jgi:sporulation protein YlmC with PRC-barrel domain
MAASLPFRRVLTSAIALAAIAIVAPLPGGGARAADPTNGSAVPEGPMLRATELIGRDIVTVAGETLGKIEDLVVSADGRIIYGVVGVGGVMGVGKTHVLIPAERLQLSAAAADTKIVMTQEELGAMPRFEYGVSDATSVEGQRNMMGRSMADWEKRMKEYAAHAKDGTADTVDSAWANTKEAWSQAKDASADTWDKAKANFQAAMDRLQRTWNDKTGDTGSNI